MAISDSELTGLINGSEVMDSRLKRAWLDVLPHLNPEHRDELRAILVSEREGGEDWEKRLADTFAKVSSR